MGVKRLLLGMALLIGLGVIVTTSYYFVKLSRKPASPNTLAELQVKVEDIHDQPWGSIGKVLLRRLTVEEYKEVGDTATIRLGFLRQGEKGWVSVSATSYYAIGDQDYYIGSNFTETSPIKAGDKVDMIIFYIPEGYPVTPEVIREKLALALASKDSSDSPEVSKLLLKSWVNLEKSVSPANINRLFNSNNIELPPGQFYLLGFLESL